ncbi:hypothetical protein Tco_0228412 [Tanacetum coccineum]
MFRKNKQSNFGGSLRTRVHLVHFQSSNLGYLIIDEDGVIPEDETQELLNEFQNVNKRVPTIFDHKRMEATMKDMLSKQFSNAEENYMNITWWESMQEELITLKKDSLNENIKEKKYILSLHKIDATLFPEDDLEEKLTRWVRKEFKTFNKEAQLSIQHWKDSWHKIIRITSDKQYGLDFIEEIIVKKDNNKPYSFFEAGFKYLNKNDIEDLYYLCLNYKVDYHKYKLLNSLHTFIRECNPYSIVDEPSVGLIYLNIKEEKMIIILTKIQKFCDATLNKVLKEVKLNIFETEYKKKTSLLGELDLKIMKAFGRELEKRLKHRKQITRWESFVNEIRILHPKARQEQSTLRGRLLGL